MTPVIISWMLIMTGSSGHSSPTLITRFKSEAACQATAAQFNLRKSGLDQFRYATPICTPEYN